MRFIPLALAATLSTCLAASAEERPRAPFELRVMSFNVNDLPSPLREKASAAMKIVGRDLYRRLQDGTAPDIVFLQEAFTKRARKLVREADYPYVAKGPGARATNPDDRVIQYDTPKDREPGAPRRAYDRLVNSGLYVLSRYPIVQVEKEVYGNDCSGSDCFANKGMVYVRIQIPEHDMTVSLATTHMDSNSKDAGRHERYEAHVAQTRTLKDFLDGVRRGHTTIVAGDLNIKDDWRYAYFVRQTGGRNAGELCVASPETCTVDGDTDPAELTRKTNDYHFILEGEGYRVEPVAMARTYAEKVGGKRLSDHSAFEATYRIVPE